MNRKLAAVIGIALSMLVLWSSAWGPLVKSTEPETAPASVVVTDAWGFASRIPSTLVGEDANHDSQMLAGLCDGMAAVIELDGKRAVPRLRYAIHVFDLRRTAVMASLGDSPTLTEGPKYPAFNEVVGEIFGDAFPDGDEELTVERRSEVAAMFRALAAACNKAR